MIPYDVSRCANAECKRALECARFMDPMGPNSPVMENACADGDAFVERETEQ